MKIHLLLCITGILTVSQASVLATKKSIGSPCDDNLECKSTYCSGELLLKQCVEYKDYIKDGREEDTEDVGLLNISAKGYPISMGDDTIMVPRATTSQPITEQVYVFPKKQSKNTLKFTKTHVHLPRKVRLKAGFARKSSFPKTTEFGVVYLITEENKVSLVTDNPIAYFGEKYHTISHKGAFPTQSLEVVKKRRKSLNRFTKLLIKTQRKARDVAVITATLISSLPLKLIEASVDKKHIGQIRTFAAMMNGRKNVKAKLKSRSFKSLVNGAYQGLQLSKTKPSMKSSNQCKHLEDSFGVRVTSNEVIIPLDKNIVVGSGTTVFSPLRTFGLQAGTMVAHHNTDTNSLELYYVVTQESRILVDTDVNKNTRSNPPIRTQLLVSPADEKKLEILKDGRGKKYYKKRKSKLPDLSDALAVLKRIPVDYDRFHQGSSACKGLHKRLTTKALKSMHPKKSTSGLANFENLFKDILKSAGTVASLIGSIDCGRNYLSADIPNSNGFDILEFAVWAHLILEASGHNDVIHAFWNDGIKQSDAYGMEALEEETEEGVVQKIEITAPNIVAS